MGVGGSSATSFFLEFPLFSVNHHHQPLISVASDPGRASSGQRSQKPGPGAVLAGKKRPLEVPSYYTGHFPPSPRAVPGRKTSRASFTMASCTSESCCFCRCGLRGAFDAFVGALVVALPEPLLSLARPSPLRLFLVATCPVEAAIAATFPVPQPPLLLPIDRDVASSTIPPAWNRVTASGRGPFTLRIGAIAPLRPPPNGAAFTGTK